jgi:RNA polymerase-binding transcription factor
MSNELDIAWFRGKLDERRAELQGLQAISEESRGTVALDQTSVGRLSRMDAIQGQAMALATQRQREHELTRIAAAIERIEDGSFGECLECGEPIAEKRLRFDPSIATCIRCAKGTRA